MVSLASALALFALAPPGLGQTDRFDWFFRFDGTGRNQDETTAACESSNGDAVFVGRTFNGPESKFDFFVQALDPIGRPRWRMVYGPMKGGGDAEYKIRYLSERYRRADVPQCVTTDGKGNIYVAGRSTLDTSPAAMRAGRDGGVALVSYDSSGGLRFATKIVGWGSLHGIAVSGTTVYLAGTVGNAVLALGRPVGFSAGEIRSFASSDGKPRETLELGRDVWPRALRLLGDGHLALAASSGPYVDWGKFVYSSGPPLTASAWREYRLTPALKVTQKSVFDASSERFRGGAVLGPSGEMLTIDGLPDGSDQISCWTAGKPKWTTALTSRRIPLPNQTDLRNVRFYLHDRLGADLVANERTVFLSGGAIGDRQGRMSVSVESFDLASGRAKSTYRHALPKGIRSASVTRLSATESSLFIGGGIGDPSSAADAWMGRWNVRPQD